MLNNNRHVESIVPSKAFSNGAQIRITNEVYTTRQVLDYNNKMLVNTIYRTSHIFWEIRFPFL